MSGIQTTQYGNAVAMNTQRAIGSEGGASVEAQVLALMQESYKTNESILKNQVQAYRAKLDLQNKYNDALSKLESYAAGYSKQDAATARTENTLSADTQKKAQSAFDKRGEGSYADAAAKAGGSAAEQSALKDRAAVADLGAQLGFDQAKLDSFMKGTMTKGDMDAMKQKLKGAMDSIGADLQLAMIDIQTVKARMDQMMTSMTTYIKSVGDKGEAIARNL